jgi:hypothetical protein
MYSNDSHAKLEVERLVSYFSKRIEGIEVGHRVLIVNWKTVTGCWKDSRVIDGSAKDYFPIIVHRAKGKIVRELAA